MVHGVGHHYDMRAEGPRGGGGGRGGKGQGEYYVLHERVNDVVMVLGRVRRGTAAQEA